MCLRHPVACRLPPIAILGLSTLTAIFSSFAAPDERLVEVTPENIPGVVLDLRYATTNNITGKVLYPEAKAYLREETIRKLRRVSRELKDEGYRLVLWDAWRPASAQKALWKAKPDGKFLTPPSKISRHRRGTSVDVSLADMEGRILAMPSDFDEFNAKADEDFSDVPKEAAKRARILRNLMFNAGFSGVPDEWWHYDLRDWADYEAIEEKGFRGPGIKLRRAAPRRPAGSSQKFHSTNKKNRILFRFSWFHPYAAGIPAMDEGESAPGGAGADSFGVRPPKDLV